MSQLVIKPDPARDEYVLWSTGVDAPVGHGTRQQILAHLENQWHWDHPHADPKPGSTPADRLDRADRTGTSALDGDYGWSDTHILYKQLGCLHRRDLYRAAQLLAENRDDEVMRLLQPLSDD